MNKTDQIVSSKEEESKAPSLLLSLREFEVSIIARYLTAEDKFTTMALLNKAWNCLLSQHYAWSSLPSPGQRSLRSDNFDFLTSFH